MANTVVGFGVLKFDSFEGANGIVELGFLGIDKQHKRNALGTELVKYIEKYALESKIRKIYVKTSPNNNIANCFWIMQNHKFEARMRDFSFKSHDDYYLGKDI
ncbi:GNAT family N-acetyltransferase [Clostridium estertheticum]|uniref:GNAT family N-acetyltransferase n=1 Tax=Clostridium estertheticum TaxID=238834 RepID=UPI0027145EED|nr:GNAT family N-acetyltransferase [Clostridium estertheticum]